jgi:hypothetical protein
MPFTDAMADPERPEVRPQGFTNNCPAPAAPALSGLPAKLRTLKNTNAIARIFFIILLLEL